MNKLNNKIKDNFTIIPNDIIRNKSLSDRARFIFCYMASMPDDWKFYQGVMAKELGYTKDTLRKYIEELLTTGYLHREQRRETGKFDSYDYTLNFTPSGKKADTVKSRNGEKPTREKSALTNKDLEQRKTNTNKDFNKGCEFDNSPPFETEMAGVFGPGNNDFYKLAPEPPPPEPPIPVPVSSSIEIEYSIEGIIVDSTNNNKINLFFGKLNTFFLYSTCSFEFQFILNHELANQSPFLTSAVNTIVIKNATSDLI